jgi:benzoate/toluate 1,2-dioxygenase subunit alpha
MDVKHVKLYVDDRPQDGVFRVHRDVYADPQLFELEMKYIFERTWNFLTIESQVARAGDYVTTRIGRTPLLVSRDSKGRLGAFVNACRHKGATVARLEQGNAKYHVCPYHGWAYDSAGKNVDIKDRAAGCYAAAFEQENHDLLPIARIESYKGLVFGSLSPDVPPLADFLGGMKFFLDCVMDQGPHGMEFLPGRIAYTYRGNWKLQLDNGLDPYHLTSTHASFLDIQKRRSAGAGNVGAKQFDWAKRASKMGGVFNFPYGHSVVWNQHPDPGLRPIFPAMGEVRERVGELRADWIINKLRQVTVYPNMQIPEAISQLLRTFHPVTAGLTEMRVYCLAPIGEKPELRAWRLRQFEDFFNPTGIATPDDVVTYEDCQLGFAGMGAAWMQGFDRGMTAIHQGVDSTAASIGIEPYESVAGPFEQAPEVGFHGPHREWARLMEAGLAGRKAYA